MPPKKRVLKKKKPVNQKQSQYQSVTVNVSPIKKAPRQTAPRQTAPRQQTSTHTFFTMQPQAQPTQQIPQEFMDNIRKISTGFSVTPPATPATTQTTTTQTPTATPFTSPTRDDERLTASLQRDREQEQLRRVQIKNDTLFTDFNTMSRKELMKIDLSVLRNYVRNSDLSDSVNAKKQTIVSYLLNQRKRK